MPRDSDGTGTTVSFVLWSPGGRKPLLSVTLPFLGAPVLASLVPAFCPLASQAQQNLDIALAN